MQIADFSESPMGECEIVGIPHSTFPTPHFFQSGDFEGNGPLRKI
jgi:hypothetical protein